MNHQIAETADVRYFIEVPNIREVSLVGTANLLFWSDKLRDENLSPTIVDGTVEIAISAMSSKWKGFRFREFIICVFTSTQENGAERDGAFLAHAFNSRRFFAFCERFFCKTPYFQGDIGVNNEVPAEISLSLKSQTLFEAKMADIREPRETVDKEWRGPIYLPLNSPKRNGRPRYFHAKIGGRTDVFPVTSDDAVRMKNSEQAPVFQWLIDSEFVAKEWHIRSSANHGKSKTLWRE